MATYTASNISNDVAVPSVLNNEGGKVLHSSIFEIAVSSAIATADLLHLARVPWGAKIRSLKIYNTDLGTDVPTKIGIAYGRGVSGKAFGLAVDDDFFATAHALGTASAIGVDIRYSAPAITTAGDDVQLNAALSATPGGEALILGTVGTVTAGATGTIVVEVNYVV